MSVSCPSCHIEMAETSERGAAHRRCGKCGKVWIREEALARYLAATAPRPAPADLDALRAECERRREALLNQSVVLYLHCPECGHRMLRRAFGGLSGIITQVCVDHGVLMSGADLQAIEDFVRRGGEVLVREYAAAQGAPQPDKTPVDWYPETP